MNPLKSILNFFAQFFSVPKQKIEPIPKLEPVVPKVPVAAPALEVPNLISLDLVRFIASVEKSFSKLKSSQDDGFVMIFRKWSESKYSDIRWLSYILATAWHETNKTMQPVREAYWLSEDWRKKNLKYYPYYGRGYVQLTWDFNYKKYGIEMVPEQALDPEMAAHILIDGMVNGVFTGKKLSNYFNAQVTDPVGARHIVNGKDKATEIAGYYYKFLDALNAAQVKAPEVMA